MSPSAANSSSIIRAALRCSKLSSKLHRSSAGFHDEAVGVFDEQPWSGKPRVTGGPFIFVLFRGGAVARAAGTGGTTRRRLLRLIGDQRYLRAGDCRITRSPSIDLPLYEDIEEYRCGNGDQHKKSCP